MQYVFDLIIIVNALALSYSSENSTASRTALPQGVDDSSHLLIVLLGCHSSSGGCVSVAERITRMSTSHRLLLSVELECLSLGIYEAPINNRCRCPSWDFK